MHYHVVELKESESALKTALYTFGGKHFVYGKMRTDVAEKLNISELKEPVAVSCHDTFADVHYLIHLFKETVGVIVDFLNGEHFSHIGLAGGVADHSGSGSEKEYRGMSRFNHTVDYHKLKEMPDVKAVGGSVKTDIEYHLFVFKLAFDFLRVSHLGNKSATLKIFINCHFKFLRLFKLSFAK